MLMLWYSNELHMLLVTHILYIQILIYMMHGLCPGVSVHVHTVVGKIS
jgi:hypothetical protein